VGWYNGIVSEFEPQIVALQNYQPQFQTARILDSRGDLIVELNSQEGGARTEVELADIAPEMLFAVIASENERFYDDPGWDLVAIVRAFFQNLSAGEVESGASTITQQIARNLVLQNAEVTAERKIQELVVAAELAKRYDKNFILELYLNEIFFGNQSYGVEAAAEYYFGHTAADLNIAESALLAGLIQSPAAYDPVINRDASFGRMDFVINRMVEVGCIQFQHAPYLSEPFCISPNDIFTASGTYTGRMAVQVAQVESRPYEPRDVQIRYPHFVNLVQAQLDAIYGPGAMFAQGFTVRTTLVPQIQDTAQNALVNQLAALVNQGVNTGAVMVTDPNTGAIRAMVGSPDFNNAEIDGQVNNALTWQQPGSSIKPIVYTGALEGVDKNGDGRLDFTEYYTPASILWDVPTSYPDGTPIRNFDGQFHGPTPLRYALGNSYNIPAVKAYGFIGDAKFQDVAARMGLDFLPDAVFGLPTGIGATEVRLYDMMEAYGTLASGGRFVRLYAIESVTDNEGRTVELPPREEPRQVVQPQIAYLMQSILSDDNARASAFGTGSVLTLPGYPTIDYVAAKTGTSNDARDLWTMGFTKTAVVGVWLGRPDNNPTFTNGSFTAVAPVWNQVMRTAVQGVQPQAFTNPGNVVLQQICTDTGALPGANCPAQRGEYFLVSNPPPPADQSFVQNIEVDSWTGLRANANCPDNRVALTFANIPDATAVNWLNTTAQGQAYAARIGLPLPLQVAPTGECPFGAIVPSVRLLSPTDGMTLTGAVSITGQVSANQAEFNRYQLYYAPATTPDQWVAIGPASTAQQPQAGAVLGQWDTRTVANGTYILRLEVIANNGGFINKQVTVNIQNVLPTATPTVPVIPTSPPILTPIPFDTLPAQSVPPGGGPTPTIAVPTG
jgi:membrane peptidoglycan carboxypeptidase